MNDISLDQCEEQDPYEELFQEDIEMLESEVASFSFLSNHILNSSFKVKRLAGNTLKVAMPQIHGACEADLIAVIDAGKGIKECALELADVLLQSARDTETEEELERLAIFISPAMWEILRRCETEEGVFVEELFK